MLKKVSKKLRGSFAHISPARSDRRTQTCHSQLYPIYCQVTFVVIICYSQLSDSCQVTSSTSEEAYFEETYPLIRWWQQASEGMGCQFAARTFAICCVKTCFSTSDIICERLHRLNTSEKWKWIFDAIIFSKGLFKHYLGGMSLKDPHVSHISLILGKI